jgi:uncharacterized protein YutD
MTFVFSNTRNINKFTTTIVRFADIFSTFGFIVADNRSKDTRVITFFSIGVTAVGSTIILIIANNIIIYTTIGGYTISTLAGVSIRAGD